MFYELPFTILITSYNNERYCEKNLESVLNQDYSNFNIVYVNDCSIDNTQVLVEKFLSNKINLINNKIRKKKLANLYEIIQSIDNQRIIIELDGDDYFANNNVLKIFNDKYNKTGAWVIYANYQNNPADLAKNIGHFWNPVSNYVIKNNLFRSTWIYSGLRTYYAGLFKKINKNDLIYKEDFFPLCHDLATFYPMLEMAGDKIDYIKEKLLIRNIDSPINDFKIYDENFKRSIRQAILDSPKYSKINSLF